MTAKKPTAPEAKKATKAAAAEETVKKAPKTAAKTVAADEDKPKRGRKPKAATEAAKPAKKAAAVEEEDLSDIEADLEGEVETEEPAAVEVVADEEKVKPLRMKVSRAKERALMREFGLDDTQLTEEEVAKRRHELKTLIKM